MVTIDFVNNSKYKCRISTASKKAITYNKKEKLYIVIVFPNINTSIEVQEL